MRRVFVGLVLLLAVALFSADFRLTWSGWIEQGFAYNKDGKIQYEQYSEVSFGGLYPVARDVDFVVTMDFVTFFRNNNVIHFDDTSKFISAYAMINPVENLTISVGPRRFRIIHYDNVWGDRTITSIPWSRLSIQYRLDMFTLTLGTFRTANPYTFGEIANDIAILAQISMSPVYAGFSYDVKNQNYYVYGKLSYTNDKIGSTLLVDAGLKGSAGSQLPVFDLGAVMLTQKVGQMDFGLKVNYYKMFLTTPQPAEVGLWFNYLIDPKTELTLKTYFETKTDASSMYASISLPWKFSKNLTAIPKVEFDQNGFQKASFKFNYSFK